MGLQKFEDFENSQNEENVEKVSPDAIEAKKALLSSFKETDNSNIYWSKKALVVDKGEDTITLSIGDDKSIILKVIGFNSK